MPIFTVESLEQSAASSSGNPTDHVASLVVAEMGCLAKARVVQQVTNMLQSSSRFSMLMYNGERDAYVAIGGDAINPLQHVERTTAECLWGAWSKREAVSESASHYEEQVRLVAEDGAGSNFRAEGFIRASRGSAFTTVEHACESHLIALGLKAHGTVIDSDVTGQIHHSLAMNFNTSRTHCRRILFDVVKDWFKCKRGPPPVAGRRHLRYLLRTCLSGERRRCEKELLMLCLPNSGPFIHGELTVWVPLGAIVDESAIMRGIANSLYDLTYGNQVCPHQAPPLASTVPGRGPRCAHGWPLGHRLRGVQAFVPCRSQHEDQEQHAQQVCRCWRCVFGCVCCGKSRRKQLVRGFGAAS